MSVTQTASNALKAANLLFQLRQSGELVQHIPDGIRPTNIDEGYAIQEIMVERMCEANNGRSIGYKVGCTSEDAQKALNVHSPFRGQLLSHSTYKSPTTLNTEEFAIRIIEPEFGFVMGQDVPHLDEGYTRETIRPYIQSLFPAIEIANHHFEAFDGVTAPEFAADNAIHGVLVMGEPVEDWDADGLASHEVTLNLNGERYASDTGDKVLGHPLNVMAWLANDGQARGKPLKAGDLIISGTVNMLYLAQQGDLLEADFGKYGSVDVTFE